MPKSSAWRVNNARERNGNMDSTESCGTTKSFKSATSDDSLQHLSAEEKACLLFLEETIKSLDTAENGSLSNNDPQSLSVFGHTTSKSMKCKAGANAASETFGTNDYQKKNYLVPTPFTLAKTNDHVHPTVEMAACKKSSAFNVVKASKKERSYSTGHAVVTEETVVACPQSNKRHVNSLKNGYPSDCRFSQGHLSENGLVKPLRSKSLNSEGQLTTLDPVYTNDGKTSERRRSSNSESRIPPVVAPKPKTIPAHINISMKKASNRPNRDLNMNSLSMSPRNFMGLMTPEKVRIEALTKLGLLKKPDLKPFSEQAPNTCVFQLAHPYNDVTQNQDSKNQVVKSGKVMEGGISKCERLVCVKEREHVIQLGTSHTEKKSNTLSLHQKPSRGLGFSTVMVPNMGEDRREALRKLGLLKD